MSVYRTLSHDVPSEVNVNDIARGRLPSATAANDARPWPAPTDEVQYHRRTTPANQPFPTTFRWVAGLPSKVRPLALLKQFPRIANMLAQASHDPAAFREFMFDLLIDKRGGRQGFPQDVRSELLALRAYIDHIHTLVRTVGRQPSD